MKQLRKVVQCEHKDVIDQLVGEFQHSGWDLAAPDKAGRTTLHYAAHCCALYAVKVLLDARVDANLVITEKVRTPSASLVWE